MTPGNAKRALNVQLLAREFDSAFAEAHRDSERDAKAFLAFRCAGRAFALEGHEAGGVTRMPRLCRVPSHQPALLGLAAERGQLVPVFSLARLLGDATAAPAQWLLIVRRADPVGFAFDELTGYVRVDPAAILREPSSNDSQQTLLELRDARYAVLSLMDLLALAGVAVRPADRER